jgi:2-polyprenyl-3-methyl-5-hydroxy-6-metoxy-1,4-benzoquinol methylase
LDDEKQKRIFLRDIGGNEESFKRERELEETIAQSILSSQRDKRESAYCKGYEELHKFLLSISNGKYLYQKNLQRAIWRQSFVQRIIGENQRVLEVGCGEGILSIALAKSGNRATGTDISDCCILMSNINKVKFAVTNVIFLKMNATKLRFCSNTFDWVISKDLIEHLHPNDVKRHLREATRVLRSKGKYLLITPNARNGIHAGLTHIREYTFEDLEALFTEAGFGVRAFLLPIVLPVNALVNVKVKLLVQRLFDKLKFAYPLIGLDPIFLVTCKL